MCDRKPIKICAVCGDRALARNFGALTCKSCKPFFRRNANKSDVFVCKNDGQCPVNVKSRKKCRKCRLDRCFAVGMRKELIMNEVEKHFRRTLVEENRKRRKSNELSKFFESTDTYDANTQELNNSYNTRTSLSSTSDDSELGFDYLGLELPENICLDDSLDDKRSDQNINGYQTISINTDGLTEGDFAELEEFITINQWSHNSVNCYRMTLDFVSQNLPIPRPVTNCENSFTQIEDYKLMELFEVLTPLDFSASPNADQHDVNTVSQMVQIVNTFYEKEIISFINSIKRMAVFGNICENDRIALVKYSCIDILMLRSIHLYDVDAESWKIPVDRYNSVVVTMDFLKFLANDNYRTYKHHLYDIIKECNSDAVVIDLLTAIALFNPNRPNIENRNIIEHQQQVYLYLLQRYLVFKFRSKSEEKFLKLLNILIFAHILGEWEKKYFIEDYSDGYCPLVKEIFDINYCKSIQFQLSKTQ